MPSVFGPGSIGISPGASSERQAPAAAPVDPTNRPGSGTLQSAPAVQINTPLPPRVILIEPTQGTTMPSEDLPILSAPSGAGPMRVVASWVVILLVIAALGAGFAVGFAVARSM